MTTVNCNMEDCVYFNKDFICQRGDITLTFGEYLDFECEDYRDITEGEDYQEKYYKRCQNPKTKREERREAKGKRIEIHGLIFYTQEDIRDKDNYGLTEEVTGLYISRISLENEKKLAIVRERLTEITPVKDLSDYIELEEDTPC